MTSQRRISPVLPTEDHRTRVGLERRERTRTKLLRAALLVFADHGVDASVIDLIIRQAGVSRGTFYNYFRTNDELFTAVAQEVSNELLRVVEPLVLRHADPAVRIACGLSSTIRLAKDHPLLAAFIVRGGPDALSAGTLVTEVVPRDVRAGMASGRFTVTDEQAAFDLILGAVIASFHTVLTGDVRENYLRELVQGVLRSLGVNAGNAQKIVAQEYGELFVPEGSLFHQALPTTRHRNPRDSLPPKGRDAPEPFRTGKGSRRKARGHRQADDTSHLGTG